jgi:hypothetical protein
MFTNDQNFLIERLLLMFTNDDRPIIFDDRRNVKAVVPTNWPSILEAISRWPLFIFYQKIISFLQKKTIKHLFKQNGHICTSRYVTLVSIYVDKKCRNLLFTKKTKNIHNVASINCAFFQPQKNTVNTKHKLRFLK